MIIFGIFSCDLTSNKEEPKEVVYTITFSSNGGTGEMVSQTGSPGSKIKLNKNSFTKDGYLFYKWDGPSGAYYDDMDEITLDTDINLSAYWLKKQTIVYHSNDGTNSTYIQEGYEDWDITAVKNKFNRDGYYFVGWNKEPDGSEYPHIKDEGEIYYNEEVISMYAIWIADNPFITRWKITSNEIWFPNLYGGESTYNSFTIDWGDGNKEVYSSYLSNGQIKHNYKENGEYTITVNGIIHGFGFHYYKVNDIKYEDYKGQLLDVEQWGNAKLYHGGYQFYQCKDLKVFSAKDKIDTSNITSMESIFKRATLFNGDISYWNTKNVENMREMFWYAESFNGDISNWDVSNVIEMKYAFTGAELFNQDLSKWNTINVNSMAGMFWNAKSFNSDINEWNTSNVTSMSAMFCEAKNFNRDLNKWDTSNVENMDRMFSEATTFNGNISNWNTSKVINMSYMLYEANNFNHDISRWDVSKVTDMSFMFRYATSFDQNLESWNVTHNSNTYYMFYDTPIAENPPSWYVK